MTIVCVRRFTKCSRARYYSAVFDIGTSLSSTTIVLKKCTLHLHGISGCLGQNPAYHRYCANAHCSYQCSHSNLEIHTIASPSYYPSNTFDRSVRDLVVPIHIARLCPSKYGYLWSGTSNGRVFIHVFAKHIIQPALQRVILVLYFNQRLPKQNRIRQRTRSKKGYHRAV